MNCRFTDKLRSVYEFLSVIAVMLFAVLPLFMISGPEKWADSFMTFAYTEFFILVLCFVAYAVLFVVASCKNSFGNAFNNLKSRLLSYFSTQRYALIFLLALIISFVSACFSPDKSRAFLGAGLRPDGVVVYMCFASLFIFSSSVRNPKYKNIIVSGYVVSFMVVSVVMLQQYFGVIGTAPKADTPSFLKPLSDLYSELGIKTGHFYKGMTGTFYNSNHMGYYIAVCSGLFSGIFIKSKSKLLSLLALILSAYSFWILILNDTFGAYIAVFVSLCFYSIYYFVTKRAGKIKSVLPILIFVSVSIIISVSGATSGKSIIGNNITQISEDVKNIAGADDKSTVTGGNGRWQLWIKSTDMISDKPLIGYGPDNLKPASLKYKMKMDRAHNEFLEIASAIGIPGALFYYIGIISAIICFLKRKNTLPSTLGASVAVMAYFISSLFGVFLFYTACHLFVMLGIMREDI